MYFSRKIIPIALLILGGFYGIAAVADSYRYIPEQDPYSNSSGQHTLDEAKARRVLAGIKGFDTSEIWFATGLESYYRNPECVTREGVWILTKPVLSSPGIWRGKKGYISEHSIGKTETDCNQLAIDSPNFLLDLKTASFIDPNSIHLEEDFDGKVPGIFQIYRDITDDELGFIASVIPRADACLKKSAACPYEIDRGDVYMNDRELATVIKIENLLTMSEGKVFGDSKPCYSMIFYDRNMGMVGMDICYRGDKQVTKIQLTTDILE